MKIKIKYYIYAFNQDGECKGAIKNKLLREGFGFPKINQMTFEGKIKFNYNERTTIGEFRNYIYEQIGFPEPYGLRFSVKYRERKILINNSNVVNEGYFLKFIKEIRRWRLRKINLLLGFYIGGGEYIPFRSLNLPYKFEMHSGEGLREKRIHIRCYNKQGIDAKFDLETGKLIEESGKHHFKGKHKRQITKYIKDPENNRKLIEYWNKHTDGRKGIIL